MQKIKMFMMAHNVLYSKHTKLKGTTLKKAAGGFAISYYCRDR